MWVYSLREGNRAAIAPRQLSGRGVSYWTDGKGDDRVIFVTTGYRLIALNAHTGQPIPSFGKNGMVDLKEGMVTGTGQQIDLETGEAGLHATPLVVKDIVIVGSSFKEGMTVVTHNNTKGLVRAFDARSGKLLWTFNTIPRPGEFGNETWENGSWATNGNTGVWTQMTVDEDLGLVYLPVESPTSDFYGGERPGDNLFGESLVCVDLKTGKRKWHFQIVHHPIWDYDLSSAPILADINVDGKAIKAVALPSKESFLYVFDRVTGEPVWPIEERPVPQSDVPGEKTSPTQPFPTKPPAYGRNYLKIPDDLIDFTPEMRAQAKDAVARYKAGPMFLPPVVGDPKGFLGALDLGNASGGTNWPGVGLRSGNAHRLCAGPSIGPVPHFTAHAAAKDFRTFATSWEGTTRDFEFPKDPDSVLPPMLRSVSRLRHPHRPRRAQAAQPACRRSHRPGSVHRETALRGDLGHQSRSGRTPMAGALRRDSGCGSQSPCSQGHEHPQHRAAGQRRTDRHQNTGHPGRQPEHHHVGASARRHAASLRQGHRQGSRRGLHARASERFADDLHGGRQAVHRGGCQRRRVFGRVHRLQLAIRELAMRNADCVRHCSRFHQRANLTVRVGRRLHVRASQARSHALRRRVRVVPWHRVERGRIGASAHRR